MVPRGHIAVDNQRSVSEPQLYLLYLAIAPYTSSREGVVGVRAGMLVPSQQRITPHCSNLPWSFMAVLGPPSRGEAGPLSLS